MGQERCNTVPIDALSRLGTRELDAVVIGAGVGGAATALQLARRLGPQRRVVLVERSDWPRSKVCGCCLNGAAVAMLSEMGLEREALLEHSQPLTSVEVRCRGHVARWGMPAGIVIRRNVLDDLIVQQAVSAGVVFVPGCSAKVASIGVMKRGNGCQRRLVNGRVVLKTVAGEVECAARLIIVADGLAGSALSEQPDFQSTIRSSSWIGLGASVEDGSWLPAETVVLNLGQNGYVGVVRMRDGSANIAAAAEPGWIKRIGGPEQAVQTILESCNVRPVLPGIQLLNIRGTPMLTRRRQIVAAPRLLVVGDAAGYVEPFTGEGMTWALASAKAAATLSADVLRAVTEQSMLSAVTAWQRWNDKNLRRRQFPSSIVRAIAHRPRLAAGVVALMEGASWPRSVAGSLARRLASPYQSIPGLSGAPSLRGDAA